MIKIDNISVGYGEVPVIKNTSFTVQKGQLISIIGANGAGKSTLLKAVTGIIPMLSGNIFIDDKNISDLAHKDIAKKIAYLAQGKVVPDMTVEQMVLHGRFPHLSYPRRYKDKDYKIAYSALEQMGISNLANKLMSSLSGGMRQNAYISMALTQATDYIMLDEPTTYLDISNQLELMQILRNLANNGKGIVTVMHDLPLAFTFSDKIAVLRDGIITACDTPDNICNNKIINKVFGVSLYYSKDKKSYYYKYFVN